MGETSPEKSIRRRSVLKRTAGALGVGGGLATSGEVTAQQADDREESRVRDGADTYEGVACGDGYPEGDPLTVERRCNGTDCDTIRLTGLSPACADDGEQLFADLPGTEPTVWMNPRNGEMPPGTYRVVRAERCERGAGECDGSDLYRLVFRPTEG